MGDKTKIAWTDATWNWLRGCTKKSPGCKNCYAERDGKRWNGPGEPFEGLVDDRGRWTGVVRLIDKHLDDPLRWRRPRMIFANSVSDTFHEAVPDEWIAAAFGVMYAAKRHIYQVLTKRADRMAELVPKLTPLNCYIAAQRLLGDRQSKLGPPPTEPAFINPPWWLGVSAENQEAADERVPHLLRCAGPVLFVSMEPLLGPIDLDADWLYPRCADCGRHRSRGASGCFNPYTRDDDCDGHAESGGLLGWLICGGESGPGARPCDIEWIRSLVRQCGEAGVPPFVKQLGAQPVLDGLVHIPMSDDRYSPLTPLHGARITHSRPPYKDPRDWSADLRVQEYPHGA